MDYEHRKAWVRERVRELSGLFSVEVCAYAVMSNHLHLVVKSDPLAVQEWSDEEKKIWVSQLFHPNGLIQSPARGTTRPNVAMPLPDRLSTRRFGQHRDHQKSCTLCQRKHRYLCR